MRFSVNVTFTFLALLFAIASINCNVVRDQCSDDYGECLCVQMAYDVNVTCNNVQPETIKQIFKATSFPVLKRVEINLPTDAQMLPADMLSGKLAEVIVINGPGRETFTLSIDIGAFSPTKAKTAHFEINGANIRDLNLGFLDGFGALMKLYFQNISGVRVIKDIKLLNNLQELHLVNCLGFTEFTDFPSGSFPSLSVLNIANNQDLVEDKLNIILTALNASTAQQTLYDLRLDGNSLTRIPLRLTNFPNLAKLKIDINKIDYLEVNNVALGLGKIASVSIAHNNLTVIEPGAFQGDYSEAKVNLDTNNLGYFYEAIFKNLLVNMRSGSGVLNVSNNPFNCDCSIAWLVVRNRDLLVSIDNGAKCTNGKLFIDLDENAYALCP